ncbi:MAG: hypothetical protein RKH07_00220 [Gammaproteobacteria bacterium]
MTGRKQAMIAVVLLGLVPLVNLLSPVVVGLVMLRKGLNEASVILAFALLPLAAWAMIGDFVPIILLFGISGLALLLRESESWEFTLLAAVGVGIAIEIYLRLQPALLDVLIQQLEVYLQNNGLQEMQMEEVRSVLISAIGAVYMFLSIALLMLARYLQASLYNPGGFQQEFHLLRIEQKVAFLLIALMLLASFEIVIPESWVLYFAVPLLFAGIGLVHGLAKQQNLSSMWLIAFYALLMLPVAIQLVVLAALVDSWYDFRSRKSKPD